LFELQRFSIRTYLTVQEAVENGHGQTLKETNNSCESQNQKMSVKKCFQSCIREGSIEELLSHLKGSKGKIKKYFIIFCNGLAERDKDHIVDPKQGDQQECGFRQPPVRETVMHSNS